MRDIAAGDMIDDWVLKQDAVASATIAWSHREELERFGARLRGEEGPRWACDVAKVVNNAADLGRQEASIIKSVAAEHDILTSKIQTLIREIVELEPSEAVEAVGAVCEAATGP